MDMLIPPKQSTQDKPLMRFENICISYGGNGGGHAFGRAFGRKSKRSSADTLGREIIHDVSFSLKAGEILGLVGESGSGKSSLIRAALGLLGHRGTVSSGAIYYKGDNILDYSEAQLQGLRGAEIGMIFQDCASSLCPIRRIGTQVYESMRAHMKVSKVQAQEKALALFTRLGFKDPLSIWNSYPFELSGGMSQRVGIALSMLLEPSVLLADEPTSALDVIVQEQVLEELKKLNEMFNTAIILVSHDMALVAALADKILVLKDGRCMDYTTRQELFSSKSSSYTKELLAALPRL